MRHIFILLLLLCIPFVLADELSMSVNQSEYYFLVGQEAFVPLEIENTYPFAKEGLFSYTITQQVQQQGMAYSSTNSQTKSYTVPDGESNLTIGLGTSNSPTEISLLLGFDFDDKKIELDEIKVFFVSDPSQQQNQENKVEDSSKESLKEQIEKKLDNMMNKEEQQTQQQQSQQKLQNNQLAQDSNALKQQMEKQMQEQQQMQQEFQKQLANNEEFQKEHQSLLEQGYNVTSANLDPTDNNSGKFELNYEKDGKQAKMSGEMENGTMKDLKKSTSLDQELLMDKLSQDERFQEFNQQLLDEGFNQSETKIVQENNQTNVEVEYKKGNETAVIKAEFEDDELKEVKLEKDKNYWWFLLLLFLLPLGMIFFKNKKIQKIEESKEKPFDYLNVSKIMLKEAQALFDEKQFKDAYGKAAQALRLYLSYKNGLNKEITNDNIIKYLKSQKMQHKNVKECFDLCTLVEFAKYQANKNDFDKIIFLASSVIKKL